MIFPQCIAEVNKYFSFLMMISPYFFGDHTLNKITKKTQQTNFSFRVTQDNHKTLFGCGESKSSERLLAEKKRKEED